MIEVKNLSKKFDDFTVLNQLNLKVNNGSIYGLVGANGAGKTTLIKHIIGTYKQDAGEVLINDEPIFENNLVKYGVGYIPDDLYFHSLYNMKQTARFYQQIFPNWNQKRFEEMLTVFKLDSNKRINKFSKGMQKQAAFILTMSCMPTTLILDEPIDGLDPLVRKRVWKYIIDDVSDYQLSVLVSSHNLKELDGICDSIGILSHGRMMIERDLDDLKSDISKIQVVVPENEIDQLKAELNVLFHEKRGSVDLFIAKGKREKIIDLVNHYNPTIVDILPLTLEEIFIYELGGDGHEIEGIIF